MIKDWVKLEHYIDKQFCRVEEEKIYQRNFLILRVVVSRNCRNG